MSFNRRSPCNCNLFLWDQVTLNNHARLGARLRGRTATQRFKKGSEKVLGTVLGRVLRRVLRRGPAMGFLRVLGRVLRRGSEKGVSRRCLERILGGPRWLREVQLGSP